MRQTLADAKAAPKSRQEAFDFLKASGEHSVKVFAVKELDAGDESFVIEKKISFKPITTRTLYLGTHHVELVVNGKTRAKRSFELIDS